MSGRRGVYPGTFNPPTLAHLAVAGAARAQRRLDRVDLALSRRPINKEHVALPTFDDRLDVLQAVAARVGWLGIVVTEATLIVDIAAGYDVVVMGQDKWEQVNDVRYYAGAVELADALARLPEVAVAPRPAEPDVPTGTVPSGSIPTGMELDDRLRLHVPAHLGEVSSTAARDGRVELMLPEARAFDARTGAWTDPSRYRAWLDAGSPAR